MNEFTPSNENLRYAWRKVRGDRSLDEADAEFERWLAAHDQGIWDACRPAEVTAKEHLEAAFEAAFPVPEGRDVPAGVTIIARRTNGKIWVLATGWTSGAYDPIEVRTLEPLPPVIPDDCMVVRASCEGTPGLGRTIWQRSNDAKTWFALDPADGGWYERPLSDLIDPKPVPEEES